MHGPMLAYPRLPHHAIPCALMHPLTSLHIIISSPWPCDLSHRCYRRCIYQHWHRHCDRCHQGTTQQQTQRTLTLSRQCSPLSPDSPHIRVDVHDHASKPERVRDTGALDIADLAPPSKLSNEPLKACAIPRAQPKCKRTVQRLRQHQRDRLRTPSLCCRHTPLSHRIASKMPPPVSLSQPPSLSPLLSLSQRRQCDHHHEGTTWRRTHPTGQRHCAAGGSGGAGNSMRF